MIDAMRRFYNLFPYPSRSLLAFPQLRASLLAHLGVWRLASVGRTENVRGLWEARQSGYPFPNAQRELETLDRALAEGRKPRILLAGCGTDEPLLFAMLHPHAHLTAMDLSARSLGFARQRLRWAHRLARFGPFGDAKRAASAEVDFVCAEAASWLSSHRDSRYEYIQCFGVLHHQPEPKALFQAMAAALAPNGILRLMIYSCRGRRLERRIQAKHRSFWNGDGVAGSRAWSAALRKAVRREWFAHRLRSLNPAGSALARRFRYLGGSKASIADALFHPSDPGLPPAEVAAWIQEQGLQVLFCSAKEQELGWMVGIGHSEAQKMLNRIAKADDLDQLVSNLTLVLRKP